MSTEIIWTRPEASAFRNYLSKSKHGVLVQLEQSRPGALTRDQLLTLPAEAIARQQLLLEGYNLAVEVVKSLADDPLSAPDDQS